MTLAELVEEAGVSARTIRFYISRGLLEGPIKAGRGAVYGSAHLERLETIRKLQAKGHTLSEMAALIGAGGAGSVSVVSAPWWQHVLADDIVIWTRADASPWRAKQLRAAIEEMASRLANNGGKRKPPNAGDKHE